MLIARWARPHSAPLSSAGRKLHLCSRQLVQPSPRVVVMSQTAYSLTPAYLPRSKPVTQYPSRIPTITSQPSTHTQHTQLHTQLHTRKTLEACFHHEYVTGGSASAVTQVTVLCQETKALK